MELMKDYNKDMAKSHLKQRFKQIKGKIDFKFDESGRFGFNVKGGLNTLSLQDYGRMCEVGYIVFIWQIKEEELKNLMPR